MPQGQILSRTSRSAAARRVRRTFVPATSQWLAKRLQYAYTVGGAGTVATKAECHTHLATLPIAGAAQVPDDQSVHTCASGWTMCQLLVSGTSTAPPGAWVLFGAGGHVESLWSSSDILYVNEAHCSQKPEGAAYSPFPHTRFRQTTPTLDAFSDRLVAGLPRLPLSSKINLKYGPTKRCRPVPRLSLNVVLGPMTTWVCRSYGNRRTSRSPQVSSSFDKYISVHKPPPLCQA